MNPTRRKPHVATGERAPARKLYLAVLLHVLVRFTPKLEPLTTPQSSNRRSDSFFDQGTVVKAGLVRLKRDIGAPRRVKPNPRRPHREFVTRVGNDDRTSVCANGTKARFGVER